MIFETTIGILTTCCAANAIYNKSLKKGNSIDELTGLYNRKFMKDIKRMVSSGDYFYVIGCDIDFFKKVNDTYGHATGDIVLKTFSQALKSMFKVNGDFIIRYGGEEFFIFSKIKSDEYTKEIVFKRTEETRKKIEELEILSNEMNLIKITASFGISTNISLSIKEMIEDADKNLYKAKKTGRNKIIL